MIRQLTLILLLSLAVAAPAQAQCYAEYRAKMDNPLRFHVGVAQIPDAQCTPAGVAAYLTPHLARDGWIFLDLLSTFGPEGLPSRRDRAGQFFLRY